MTEWFVLLGVTYGGFMNVNKAVTEIDLKFAEIQLILDRLNYLKGYDQCIWDRLIKDNPELEDKIKQLQTRSIKLEQEGE